MKHRIVLTIILVIVGVSGALSLGEPGLRRSNPLGKRSQELVLTTVVTTGSSKELSDEAILTLISVGTLASLLQLSAVASNVLSTPDSTTRRDRVNIL